MSAVTLPFSQLKLGGKVSGDSPLSLLKRKKEAKKEKNSPTLILYGNASHEDYTENLTNKTPPEGHTGGCCRRNITLFTVEIGG